MSVLKSKGIPSVFDEQIKTPKHDELCLLLLKKETIDYIIKSNKPIMSDYLFAKKRYLNNIISYEEKTNSQKKFILTKKEPCLDIKKHLLKGYFNVIKQTIKVKEIKNKITQKIELEHPLQSKNFLIGVLDAHIILGIESIIIKEITTTTYTSPEYIEEKYTWANEISNNDDYKEWVQTTKNELTETKSNNHQLSEFYVEAKPNITSIGEVLRQINVYLSYLRIPKHRFVLLTTKSETESVFRTQDISFVSLEKLEIALRKQQTLFGDYDE